jgi:deoxyribodipyrimidine photo-lyase
MNLAPVALMWFRRDLRTCDNSALNAALASGLPVLPLFVFDDLIIGDLPSDDPRISFIYQQLSLLNHDFAQQGSGLLVLRGQSGIS